MSPLLDRTKFDKAADIIERDGFWDGSSTEDCPLNGALCLGLALGVARSTSAEVDHAAYQLGWDGNGSAFGFIYRKNDEFQGRPDEGKEWAVGTLRRLARGESLV